MDIAGLQKAALTRPLTSAEVRELIAFLRADAAGEAEFRFADEDAARRFYILVGVVLHRLEEKGTITRLRKGSQVMLQTAVRVAALRQQVADERALVRYKQTWDERKKHLARAREHQRDDSGAPSDLLMWIGSQFYPTIDDFVAEAQILGCSKRIARIPDGLRVGQTRVFLVHGDSVPCKVCTGKGFIDGAKVSTSTMTQPCEQCDGRGRIEKGMIFGFFLVDHVDLIISKNVNAQSLAQVIRGLKVRMIPANTAREEPRRGCGSRPVGAMYMVSDANSWKKLVLLAEQMADKIDVKGGIAVFKTPIRYKGKRFLGCKRFDAREYRIKLPKPDALPLDKAVTRAKIRLEATG
jgi:hypothetical protein